MNAPVHIPEIGAAALAKLIQTKVSLSVQNAVPESVGLLRVRGKLGTVRAGNYQKAFGVKLLEGAEEVLLDIPKEIISKLQLKGGEVVVATGVLTAQCTRFTNHRVEIHMDVAEIEAADRPEVSEAEKADQMTLARLKGLSVRRQPFPLQESITVSVVLSRSGQAQVDQDFLQELLSVGDQVEIEKIPVNILSAEDIADGIRRANGDVVALIRGGGSEDQFDVFENPDVVEALATKSAYRVIGLGHTANTTILDLLADYAANTPTKAGAHIRDMIEHHTRGMDDIRRRLAEYEKTAAATQDALLKAKTGEVLANRVAQERESQIKSLQKEMSQSKGRAGAYSAMDMAIAFIVGVAAMVIYVKFIG